MGGVSIAVCVAWEVLIKNKPPFFPSNLYNPFFVPHCGASVTWVEEDEGIISKL
jgi:hypothetical protein